MGEDEAHEHWLAPSWKYSTERRGGKIQQLESQVELHTVRVLQ
jgi:hypothetical protein